MADSIRCVVQKQQKAKSNKKQKASKSQKQQKAKSNKKPKATKSQKQQKARV